MTLENSNINSSENWSTKSFYLKHIGETIQLPDRMRIKYGDEIEQGPWKSQLRAPALTVFTSKTNPIDIIIDPCEGQKILHSFVRGHEDGHAADYTGNLKKLWQSAKELGYQFYFFTEEDAEKSDEAVKRLCSGMYEKLSDPACERDVKRSWNKELNPSEIYAHIGGLIALKKLGTDESFLKKLEENIKTGNYLDVICMSEF